MKRALVIILVFASLLYAQGCKFLLDDLKLLDDRKTTPLHQAVKDGNIASVKTLIKGGAEVNAQDQNGDTPYHILAKKYGHNTISPTFNTIAKHLNDAGANPSIKNDAGQTVKDIIKQKGKESSG